MVGGMVTNVGTGIKNIWGSDDPPKAILNRYAAGTAKGVAKLGKTLTNDVNKDALAAFNTYMAEQGRQGTLAGQQEGVLNTLLQRRLGSDPNQLLQSIGNTAFGFINPNVVNPLAQFDVNSNRIDRLARGLNSAAVDSTADRLRNARIASGRYYDVARNVYGALPGLYNSAYGQGVNNDAMASGYIPQIAGTYNAVSERPTYGIMNRVGTVGSTIDTAARGINAIKNATQGYQEQRNLADKIGETGISTGQQMQEEEAKMMAMIQSVVGSMGSAQGGSGASAGGGGAATAAAGGGGWPSGGGSTAKVFNSPYFA